MCCLCIVTPGCEMHSVQHDTQWLAHTNLIFTIVLCMAKALLAGLCVGAIRHRL